MKKYRTLTAEDITQEGDEWSNNGWVPVPTGWRVGDIYSSVRRPIPHEGHVQFLMHVSILVPVVVNCDDKTQEEIEDEAGRLAVEKILADPTQYVHLENINWDGSKVDDVQPEWRILEEGEVIRNGDEVRFLMDGENDWNLVTGSAGNRVPKILVSSFRRRIN